MTGTAMTVSSAPDFAGMLAVAKELVPTGFLPEHIKTPGQCVAIILAGRELGMEPMLALRSITMVKGKIVIAADAQLALFKSKGGRAQFTELTDTRAVLHIRHPNGDEHTESFSMEDAKRAGLTKNPTWTSYPKAMLRSRVITAGLKSVGFEPTAGAYDPEEAAAFAPALTLPREIEGEAVEEALEVLGPDSQITWGTKAGTALRDLDYSYLTWGIDEGRKFGERTAEWQEAMRQEMDRREIEAEAEAEAVAGV